MEPIVSFAEALVSRDCHVIHNNSFRTPKGGGFSNWHQDDAAHYIVTEGEAPTNVRLPVLFFTANYYLTDAESPEYGTTEVIRGSHLFGRDPFKDPTPPEVTANCGPAGSVTLFNNQVWHRGGPNQTDRMRYITQIT
jgi:ectoine hydroxylase-related dioxygenase (phytanoyl-CoA dioxygenase family)